MLCGVEHAVRSSGVKRWPYDGKVQLNDALQRRCALIMISAYRTMSAEAALAAADFVLFEQRMFRLGRGGSSQTWEGGGKEARSYYFVAQFLTQHSWFKVYCWRIVISKREC